ncbi:MAG: sulfate permease [Chloroflexota bacterium]|nr:sulfate permease [Chloroflexota bacterium]
MAQRRPLDKSLLASLGKASSFFFQPARILRSYDRSNFRPDFIAGLTVAVVLVPQAIVFALVADLPPQVGLYTAVVAAIVGALWGSSHQLHTGPTNTSSLLALSVLLPLAVAGPQEYVAAAALMAVMIGVFRLVMGLAGLGVLVNFVSDSVVVGFTAGAGILICVSQLSHLLGLNIPSSPSLITTSGAIIIHLPETHAQTILLGIGTLILILLIRRFWPKLPAPLLGMIAASVVVALSGADQQGVRVLGELPRTLPQFAVPPIFNFELIADLSTGALAVSVIGLIEAMSISRSIASQTGQRLDSNQEFIGQGLANIACGFFSGYPCSGSFTRSAVNFESGARSQVASVISGLLVMVIMLAVAPMATYVPRTALAAVLIVTALGMIDRAEISRIWQGTQGDKIIMLATLLATLLLPLQFAVLTGILMSLAFYLWRTSVPQVRSVVPDESYQHMVEEVSSSGSEARPACPQLGMLEIMGDIYFGAANNIEDAIIENLDAHPGQRYLVLRMHSVNEIDISGIHMLENVVRIYRDMGGDVFFVRVREPVLELMESVDFIDMVGTDHILDEDGALGYLFHKVLDPAICIYECEVRVFKECQNLPKRTLPVDPALHTAVPASSIPTIAPADLWKELSSEGPPLVLDVREPREYRRAHVPQAELLPLPQILMNGVEIPSDRPVVLTCQTGRRSTRAAQKLRSEGYENVMVLEGGLVAWEAAKLLEAVD